MISVLLRTLKWVELNRETNKLVVAEVAYTSQIMIKKDGFQNKNSLNWPRPQKPPFVADVYKFLFFFFLKPRDVVADE